MRHKFAHDLAEVRPEMRTSHADDTFKEWARGPEETSVFWTTISTPFIRRNAKSDCATRLQRKPQQVARDSEWLLQKMALRAMGGSPSLSDVDFSVEAPAVTSSPHEVLVRDTHRSAMATDEYARDI